MTRTQTVMLALTALVGLSASGVVAAQGNARIGYVNLNAIIQNAPQIAEINQRLRDEFASRETSFNAMQEDYNSKAETYQRDAEVMGAAERLALEREITQMGRDIERRAQELQEDLQIRQQELINELQVTIVQQVQQFAAANGFDLVVTDAIYVSSIMDISAEVYEAITGISVSEVPEVDPDGPTAE